MQNEKEKTVIVLGVARSGTALVTGLLHIIGVNLRFRMNPSTRNPGGAHDDSDVVSLMYKMGIDRQRGGVNLKEKYDKDIKELMKGCRKPNEMWGWKSALTHFYVDLFLPYTYNPHFVIIFRNPLHIIKSGLANEIKTYDITKAVAEKTMAIGEQISMLGEVAERYPEIPQIYTTFEDIKADPVKETERLAHFLGVGLEEKQIGRIDEFVIPDYSSWDVPMINFKRPLRRFEYMSQGLTDPHLFKGHIIRK